MKELATAASLWAVAAIGLAVGSGLYVAAVTTTLIVLVILAGVKPIEEHVRDRLQTHQLLVIAKRGALSIGTLHDVLGVRANRVKPLVLMQDALDEVDTIQITLARLPKTVVDEVLTILRSMPSVLGADLI